MKLFRRFDIFIVLAAFSLSMLMYPKTLIIVRHMISDAYTLVKLSNYAGDNSIIETPDENRIQVVFIFDDGWQSVYTSAYPLFEEYGYKGSIAIIPSLIDEAAHMTYSQIGELYMDGWDILNHSYSHDEDTDSNTLFADVERAKDWMHNRFLSKCEKMAVIPYGECDPYLIKHLMDSGYDNVRTSDNIIIFNQETTVYYPVNTISLLQELEVDDVKASLLDAWEKNETVEFILHRVEQTQDQYQMTYAPNRLKAILQYIHDNEDKFQVIPYSSLFE